MAQAATFRLTSKRRIEAGTVDQRRAPDSRDPGRRCTGPSTASGSRARPRGRRGRWLSRTSPRSGPSPTARRVRSPPLAPPDRDRGIALFRVFTTSDLSVRIRDVGRRAIPRAEKYEKFVIRGSGCWGWKGSHSSVGYAKMSETLGGKTRHLGAHRVAYELFVGPIPAGLQIHHVCENRGCVNPQHLRIVTTRDNLLLSSNTLASQNRAKTHCPHGHEYTVENTGPTTTGGRRCRRCARDYRRARVAAMHAASAVSR